MIKNFTKGLVVGVIMTLSLPVFGNVSQLVLQEVAYKITLNGNELKPKQKILSHNGTTYLSLRDVAEATGLNVEFKNSVIQLTNSQNQTSSNNTSVPKNVVNVSNCILVSGNEDDYGISFNGNIISIDYPNYISMEVKKDEIPTNKIDRVYANVINSKGYSSQFVFYGGYVDGKLYLEKTFANDIAK